MAENGLRRGLVVLVLMTALVAAGALFVAGGALQEGVDDDASSGNDTISPENRSVDVDRVNVTVELDPNDDLEESLNYELAVVGEVEALNDAANGTVDCTRELCVINGTVAADAEGEELPRYQLHGVVTGAAPSKGFTAHVNGTLEGNAIEGLGLGAYNVSAPNETDGGSNGSVANADGGASETETSAASIPTVSDAGSDDASGTDSGSSDANEESSESSDANEADSQSNNVNEADSGTGDASEEASASESESTASASAESSSSASDAETLQTDGGEQTETASDESSDEGAAASVSFDGCSSATVEGDAYGYEAGLRYYVSDGLDTSTYDESGISTPATIDGNDVISDARATDVVIESVLVLDENFQVVAQAENPNYEDCVDTIEQQYQESQGESGGSNASE